MKGCSLENSRIRHLSHVGSLARVVRTGRKYRESSPSWDFSLFAFSCFSFIKVLQFFDQLGKVFDDQVWWKSEWIHRFAGA